MLADIRVTREVGHASPRIGPPLPVRSEIVAFRETASRMHIDLMPWQDNAARYLTATNADGLRLYREVCIVVARQNGKTTLMHPYIIGLLRAGKRVMHIAQVRALPQAMFRLVADSLEPGSFPKRRGKGGRMQTVWPRFGQGTEEITLANGGSYRIAAAGRGSARGWSNDVVIIDELREMDTQDVIASAESTVRMSLDPQMVYLSNAGHDKSVVLNSIRARAGEDENLAYLEWSAAPERRSDDRVGWAEANPALGNHPAATVESLAQLHRKHVLGGTMPVFETENLCRWVATMRDRLVDDYAWGLCHVPDAGKPKRPALGISMDPDGKRASAVLAWQLPDGGVALRLALEATATGDQPIDAIDLGTQLRDLVRVTGAYRVAFDPMTDRLLQKFLDSKPIVAKGIGGQEFGAASAHFMRAVQSRSLIWDVAGEVTDDLVWTARKQHDETGTFQAVRADDSRPITASLAAIRAVYLASGPVVSGGARIW